MFFSGFSLVPMRVAFPAVMMIESWSAKIFCFCFVFFHLVVPHFAQIVEQSVATLAKDPRGEVDEAQFIEASKLVIKKVFFLFVFISFLLKKEYCMSHVHLPQSG